MGDFTFLGGNDGTTTDGALYRPYTMPEHDVTFTAKWSKNATTILVKYKKGTEEAVDNMPVNALAFDGAVFRTLSIRYRYTFTGWIDGSGNTDKLGDAIPTTTTGDDLTLTAQWTAVSLSQHTILSGVWKHERPSGDIWFGGIFCIKND